MFWYFEYSCPSWGGQLFFLEKVVVAAQWYDLCVFCLFPVGSIEGLALLRLQQYSSQSWPLC